MRAKCSICGCPISGEQDGKTWMIGVTIWKWVPRWKSGDLTWGNTIMVCFHCAMHEIVKYKMPAHKVSEKVVYDMAGRIGTFIEMADESHEMKN